MNDSDTRRSPSEDDGECGYICFAAQDWWYHNQSHSDFQLMRQIARSRRVLVVNSIGMRMPLPGRSSQPLRRILRKVASVSKGLRRPIADLPGFAVMSPLVLPAYSSALGRRVNATLVRAQVRLAARWLGIHTPVFVVTLPTAWDVVAPLRRRGLVFNRSDRHSAFSEGDGDVLRALEDSLFQAADAVTYVSRSLMDEEAPRTNGRGRFLDHGVDLDHFTAPDGGETAAAPENRTLIDPALTGIDGPVIGFFGALDEDLVDIELLCRVATAMPDATLVLIGDATGDMTPLTDQPNVRWLGPRPYADIPRLASCFDVALMPWLDNEWIRSCNPIKLKEYLALGLPVVSTPFPALEPYHPVVEVASSPDDYVAAIRFALRSDDQQRRLDRRASVADRSWSRQADELRALCEAVP